MNEGSIRLACSLCDRDDCDGVSAIPEGWEDVCEDTVPDFVMKWWTHLGTCPDCAKEHG